MVYFYRSPTLRTIKPRYPIVHQFARLVLELKFSRLVGPNQEAYVWEGAIDAEYRYRLKRLRRIVRRFGARLSEVTLKISKDQEEVAITFERKLDDEQTALTA